MQAYAEKTKSTSGKSVMKEEQQGFEPEPSGIINLAGGGRSLDLPDTLRSRVRTQFGLNMDSLRVKESAQVADLGASAMAQGNIISFAPGVFNPNTSSGQEIIGHELHHITEQARGLGSNIEGSNIHYNPSSESASDAAGRAFASGFAQGEGASFAPSVTPVAASAAPVQGKGIRSFLSKIFGQKRRQRQNQVPGDQPGVQPGDQLGVQPDPSQSGQPVPPNQPVIPDPSASLGSGPSQVNQPPVPETESDRKLNDDIYAMEQNFFPSPTSGMFKKIMTDGGRDAGTLVDQITGGNDIFKMKFRREKGIKRGMSEAEIDKMKAEDVIKKYDHEVLNQYYGSEGEDKDLFEAKTNDGIKNEIKMTYHADAKNAKFSDFKENRMIKDYTYIFHSKLREFVRRNKENNLSKKDSNDLFGRKVYRSIILDVMEKDADVKSKGYDRDTLKAIYEKLHVIKKDEEKEKMKEDDHRRQKSSNTGLLYNDSKLPSASDSNTDEYKKIEKTMKNFMETNCGHSWIETNSYDANNNHRVRFTMGFWPEGDNSGSGPLSKVPGTVMNPDQNDNLVGSSNRTDTIDRKSYLKALKFAKNFRKDFSLSGKVPGAANCTTFASGMANAAGMKVQSSKRMLLGSIHAPDIAATDKGMTKPSDDEYKMGSTHYSEVTVPKEVNINDNKAGELFMEACKQNEKYKNAFVNLADDYKLAGNIVLREKLLESFRDGSETKQAFILTALHNFEKNNVVPDTLGVFIDLEVKKLINKFSDAVELFKEMERISKDKTEWYLVYNEKEIPRSEAPKTSAKQILNMLDAKKEELQQAFLSLGLLEQKWKDPQYADAFLRALTIALEMHLPAMYKLTKIFEQEDIKPDSIARMIYYLKNKQVLIDEFKRVFLEYAGGDRVKTIMHNTMYFGSRTESQLTEYIPP